ncbi:HVA22-like protein d [Linum perenne]
MSRFWTFLTHVHALAGPVVMLLYPLIPIWYTAKLMLAAWLVLPQFRGAAFIYERFVRAHIRKHLISNSHSSASGSGVKAKNKFVQFVSSKKDEQEAY